MNSDEEKRVGEIRNGNEEAFEELFFEYYSSLCRYAFKILKSKDLASDAVQEVFLKIWRRRASWDIYHSLRVYLYHAVRNKALDLLERKNRQQNITKRLSDQVLNSLTKKKIYQQETYKESDEVLELVDTIWNIVEDMSERRKTVFTLYRRNGLSYKEIAKVMGITRKTVENHMALALQTIREEVDS